jgi:arylsulfatase A-like enzyme
MPDDQNRPNVVLITTHDLGQHLGCYGIDELETPAIDGLASEGVRFENSYATAPVCSPARGSLLSGRYPQSNGLMGLGHAPWWWEIDDGEVLLPELLSEAGYSSTLCGFQHVGTADRLGFDRVAYEGQEAEETMAAARSVFEASDDEPFYAQIGFQEVHRAFTHGKSTDNGVFVPPYLEESDQIREDFARYQAEIEYFDECVENVLEALEANGLRDETIVVLAADHGIPHPGAKWTARKPGIETALIMDGPDQAFEPDTVEAITSGVDLLPTLLDVLDLPILDRIEGVSFAPYLRGESATPPREMAFAQFTEAMKRDNESRCVITADHHLIRYFDQGRTVDYPIDIHPQKFAHHEERMPTMDLLEPRPFAQLFDVQADPYELTDLGSEPEHVDTVQALSRELLRWMVAVDDPLLQGRVRIPYYERSMEDLYTSGLGAN